VALDFIYQCSELEATIFMVSMWHIRDSRNKFCEGDGMMHPKSLAAKIKAYIDLIYYKSKPSNRREPSS
jgi:hypothetical protein